MDLQCTDDENTFRLDPRAWLSMVVRADAMQREQFGRLIGSFHWKRACDLDTHFGNSDHHAAAFAAAM